MQYSAMYSDVSEGPAHSKRYIAVQNFTVQRTTKQYITLYSTKVQFISNIFQTSHDTLAPLLVLERWHLPQLPSSPLDPSAFSLGTWLGVMGHAEGSGTGLPGPECLVSALPCCGPCMEYWVRYILFM